MRLLNDVIGAKLIKIWFYILSFTSYHGKLRFFEILIVVKILKIVESLLINELWLSISQLGRWILELWRQMLVRKLTIFFLKNIFKVLFPLFIIKRLVLRWGVLHSCLLSLLLLRILLYFSFLFHWLEQFTLSYWCWLSVSNTVLRIVRGGIWSRIFKNWVY